MKNNEKIRIISKVILDELNNFIPRLQDRTNISGNPLAYPSSFCDGTDPLISIQRSRYQIDEADRHLRKEPFIAYVKLMNVDTSDVTVYFICRGYTPDINPLLPDS